ncbi:MAG: RNA-binding protein [Chloroflexi bacterium]|jgi:cold-inducible RNA-binding protein|nr:RNA-binding protein [Chloroflexota bacterium]
MQTKVYVGNLSFDTNEESLKELFSEAGEVVSANIITDKFSGRSKGFGFVEFKTEEGMKAAIEKFNGYSYMDRDLRVDEARPPEKREGGYNRGGNRGGGNRRGGGGGYNRDRY